MKRLIYILSIAGIIFSCNPPSENGFTIEGSYSEPLSGMIYLQDRVSGLMINVDSTEVTDGKFSFKGKVDNPVMYYLQMKDKPGRLGIFVENSPLKVTIAQTEPLNYTVEGSSSHDLYKQVSDMAASHDERLRVVQQNILDAEVMNDSLEADRLRELYEKTELIRKEEILNILKEYPDKHAAVFIASRELVHGASAEELAEIFSVFSPSLGGQRYYDDMQKNLAALEKVSVGKPSIDFAFPDPDGNDVALSDLKGKFVLISFWASWCPYCREENPNLVKVYEQHGGDNFEVLGVSLDRDAEAWKKGIEEDGLKWIHVSDLNGWNSEPAGLYAIKSIPQNVLIDREGTIIARNVKYHELGEMLTKLLTEV